MKFYASLDPDPWQAAHDAIDQNFETKEAAELAYNQFAKRCVELVQLFKKAQPLPQKPSYADAFIMANQDGSYSEAKSQFYEQCVHCNTKNRDALSITKGPVRGQMVLICEDCKKVAGNKTTQKGTKAG